MPTPGSKGQPQYAGSDAVTIAAYLTALANYSALVGNRKVLTTAQRNALTEADGTAWTGLKVFDLGDGNEYIRGGGQWIVKEIDTGWDLSAITLGAGWGSKTDPNGATTGSTLAGGVRRKDAFCEVRFRCTRTGTAITSSAGGNIADVQVASVPLAYAPTAEVYQTFAKPGSFLGSVRINENGAITITDTYPNQTIQTGDIIQVTLHYLLG